MNACVTRPCLWTLSSTDKTLYVDDLSHDNQSQRQDAFQLVTDATQRADNVAVDEFTPDFFSLVLRYVDVAVMLYEPSSDDRVDLRRLLGLIIVTECRFVRSPRPRACQLFLFTSAELSGRQLRRDLVHLGLLLISESRRQYIDCFAEVFVPCLELAMAMRDEGFLITACIPTAGVLAGHSGHVDSYIMYKQLDARSTQPPMVSFKDEEAEDDDDNFTLLPLPDYLPCRCTIDGGQTQIIVRALRRDEVGDFYAAVKQATASGNGYGFDELSGLNYFTRWYVDDKYNLVYELATSDADDDQPSTNDNVDQHDKRIVVGYNNFGTSVYSRSHESPMLFDGNMIIRPEYRGRRWAGDLTKITQGIEIDCGVRSFFEETFITNVPAARNLRRTGAIICGTVPRNTYVRDFGFVDGILFYKPLDECQSFRLANGCVQSKI